MTTYVTSIWSKALLMVSYIIYLVVWGYGDWHEHFICRLGMGSFVIVMYVMCIWPFEYELLTWLYYNVSLIMIMLYVDGIYDLYMFYGKCIKDVQMT